ncbi:MAG: DUF1329 domain-containing protein [Thermodesulfobacteriota bacterium]|nr:DUF1329 domain-containing protein [Thermodesulfobacteriota bacterium]
MKNISMVVVVFILIPLVLVAEEIKPGRIIKKENYQNYLSDLKRLVPSSQFKNIAHGLQRGWITMPIVEKRNYYPPKGFVRATSKNGGKCKIMPVNKLIGWEAGLPFPDPKTPVELAWDTYRRRQMAEDLEIYFKYLLFTKEINMERSFTLSLWKKFWVGRTDIPPIPELPGNNGVLNSKESIVIKNPYDVKGFSMVRIRYEDIERVDEVYSYIPALRRIRRLTGSDVCDPMLGSDQIYDDFECWRQKIDPKMTFNILGVRDFLVPRHYTNKPSQRFMKKNCFQVEWEMRPLWILVIFTNDSDYAYSRRILYIEKTDKTCSLYGGDFYDQKGRLWRNVGPIIQASDPETLFRCWWGVLIADHISGHSSTAYMSPKLRNILVPLDVFTIKGLLKRAK